MKVTQIIVCCASSLAYWAVVGTLMAGVVLDCIPGSVEYPCAADGARNIAWLKMFSAGLAIYVLAVLLIRQLWGKKRGE